MNRRFLVVSHTNHFIGNVTATTATVSGPEGLRALSGDEAVEAGLMPRVIHTHWHDLGGVDRRLAYVHGTETEVLIVDPEARYADTCELTNSAYSHNCPDDDYRYTWYEAPEGSEVKVTFRETWYEMGKHKQTVEFTVVIGANGVPERPEEVLHIGIPDANSQMHPMEMSDHWWNQFIGCAYHTTLYDPAGPEEREFRQELRDQAGTAGK